MIQVEHLSKYFGPVMAVNDVTFQVEKGEIVGLLPGGESLADLDVDRQGLLVESELRLPQDRARLRDPAGPGLVRRAVRWDGGYVLPRPDGRYVLGGTVEERGVDAGCFGLRDVVEAEGAEVGDLELFGYGSL